MAKPYKPQNARTRAEHASLRAENLSRTARTAGTADAHRAARVAHMFAERQHADAQNAASGHRDSAAVLDHSRARTEHIDAADRHGRQAAAIATRGRVAQALHNEAMQRAYESTAHIPRGPSQPSTRRAAPPAAAGTGGSPGK